MDLENCRNGTSQSKNCPGVDECRDLEYSMSTFLWHDIQKQSIRKEFGLIVVSQSELFENWYFRAWGFRPEDLRLFFHHLVLFTMFVVVSVTGFEGRARGRSYDAFVALLHLQIP
jgi:hypothetical protein